MKNRDKIRYLKQFMDVVSEHEELWDSYYKFLQKLKSPKCPQLSDMPQTRQPAGETLSGKIALKEQFEEIIEAKSEDLLRIRIDIENIIGRVQDESQQRLLRLRYLDGYEWEKICVKINYSWRHTHRLHSEALNSVYIDKT